MKEATAISASVEDYLTAIYRLTPRGKPVGPTRLAEFMGLSAPSISVMMKRLSDQGQAIDRKSSQAWRGFQAGGRGWHQCKRWNAAAPGDHKRGATGGRMSGGLRARESGTSDRTIGRCDRSTGCPLQRSGSPW